jgi:hypothetical protein
MMLSAAAGAKPEAVAGLLLLEPGLQQQRREASSNSSCSSMQAASALQAIADLMSVLGCVRRSFAA